MALPAPVTYEVQEYLASELKAERKNEFYDGYIIAMAGAGQNHIQIQTNLIVLLATRFKATLKDCTPFSSDARVKVNETRYFYPDITVVCGKPQMDAINNLLNPIAVIEILSPGTASFDRNEKAEAYRQVPSLKQLVLVDSQSRNITIYERIGVNRWTETKLTDDNSKIEILEIQLTYREIYEKTEL